MNNLNNQSPQSEKRFALRRMLIVLTIAVAALIYAYGWTVTEIDLSLPQEEQRQTTLTRALRELLSPRIFDQERVLTTFDAPFLMGCSTGDAPEQASLSSLQPTIAIEPACAESDDIITVRVANIEANADARLRWVPPAEGDEAPRERPLDIIEIGREEFVLDSSGSFTGTIEVPRIRGSEGEIQYVRLLVAVPDGPITFSDTAKQVFDRMVQTVFMALVATTVAIPIAALLSFFAARNLMRRVRLSVGSMLLSFIVFALGVMVGGAYLTIFARWGISVGKGEVLDPIGPLAAVIIPLVMLAVGFFAIGRLRVMGLTVEAGEIERENRLVTLLIAVIRTLLLLFLIGAVSGLCILGGDAIMRFADSLRPAEVSDIIPALSNALLELIWSVGNILVILGTLLELFIAGVTGLVVGFTLSGVAGTFLSNPLRHITGLPGHIVAGIMGAISGGILMGVLSLFGLWATLLGILLPVVGGALGGQALAQILNSVWPPRARMERWEIILRQVVYTVGYFGTLVFISYYLNVERSLIDGTLPSQNHAIFMGIDIPIPAYVFEAAMIGAVLGGISGLFAGLQAIFPLGNMLYNTARATMNIVRSIEPLIMGLVFVIWVGIGPFAGVLALTLHSIASLGKLYSEQIENIDPGPIEALQSTGANQLQTIIYAVVPQIIPPYIAFTMYRWDINVRMSTIIGFVGGGGIGLLLQQQINLLRYRDAGVAVLAIAIVVSVLDYASAAIRERLI